MPSISPAFDNRWNALIILCTGMLMIVLDATVVNVALSSIQHDLKFSSANLAWPINAYMIAFGGALLLAGRLGDLIGKKRVFMVGLVVFTIASLLCGFANSQWMLIGARFVQGLGGAMAAAVILAMIYTTFADAGERAKALSIFSFTASAGGSVGLLVGGSITQALNWHWIFLVNVPIGIVTYFFAQRLIPDAKGIGLNEGADGVGAAFLTASLMLAVYAIIQIPQAGLSAIVIVCGLLSAGSMIAFLVRQARIEKPLLSLRIFRTPSVVWSNVLQVLICSAFYAFFFLYSLYLRGSLHYGAVATGFAFLPVTLAIAGLSIGPSAWLMRVLGIRATLVGGLAIAAAGLAIFAFAPADASYLTVILPGMTLMGVGVGAAFPGIMEFAMATATPSDSGLISGLVNTTAEVGGALGLAILAAVASTAGDHLAFVIATVCLVAGAGVAAVTLPMPALASATPEYTLPKT